MHAPKSFTRIVDKKRYSVETAELVAGDDYWDGHNFERGGTNMFLYKTKKGAWFTVVLTQWEGKSDRLTPISEDEAIRLYESILSEHEIPYEEAFPKVTITNA